MSYQRTHRYCGGKGEVPRSSGLPGHCFGCNGTGQITVYTAAEKAARKAKSERWEATRELVRAHARKIQAPAGVSSLTFSLDVRAGFENLGEREPQRLERLYASLDAGRVDDVVYALYNYRTAKADQGESCTACGKQNLPAGWMCDRDAESKGLCLRCCPHNHG